MIGDKHQWTFRQILRRPFAICNRNVEVDQAEEVIPDVVGRADHRFLPHLVDVDQLSPAGETFNGADGPTLQRWMLRIGITEFSVVHGSRLDPDETVANPEPNTRHPVS